MGNKSGDMSAMHFAVNDSAPPSYGRKVGLGVCIVCACDFLWISLMWTVLYAPCIVSPRSKTVGLACGVMYSVLASCVAATFVCDTYGTAAPSGALIGLLAFGTFNLTTYWVSSPYKFSVAVVDTFYGVGATALLFVVQHAASG